MSTALLDDKLIDEQEYSQLLRRHPEIMEDVEKDKQISHKFDLPYGAGYSLNGGRIYIDRHVPLIWPMKRRIGHIAPRPSPTRRWISIKAHIIKYPVRHESFESACIRLLKMKYEPAHHFAVRAEWSLITADGFDWDFYEAQWTPLIKADEREKLERVPPDLDLTPYEGTPLHDHLKAKMEATKRTARGMFLRKDDSNA